MIHIYYSYIVNKEVVLPEPFFSKHKSVGCDSRRNEIVSTYLLLKQIKDVDLSTLKYDENGKPFIIDKNLSISHDEDIVAIAISDSNLGVDILNPNKNYDLVQKSLGIEDKLEFCKAWTIIESYMKYLGLGLKAGYKNIKVNLDNNSLLYKEEPQNVQFKNYQLDTHVLGLVSERIDNVIFDKVVL